jgi:hypothetical protein
MYLLIYWHSVYLMALLVDLTVRSVQIGKINILGGHSIGHCMQQFHVCISPIPNSLRDRATSLFTLQQQQQQQHCIFWHELQSALMLTVEFSKIRFIYIAYLIYIYLSLSLEQ